MRNYLRARTARRMGSAGDGDGRDDDPVETGPHGVAGGRQMQHPAAPVGGNPGTTLGTASFGVITQTSVAPRLIQFGLKYLF